MEPTEHPRTSWQAYRDLGMSSAEAQQAYEDARTGFSDNLDFLSIIPSGTALIDHAVSVMREYADAAAHDLAGAATHCWDTESLGGIPRVIAIRQYDDRTTDQDIVAVPLFQGVAEHVAAWDPPTARAAAALLEAVVRGDDPRPAAGDLARAFMNIHGRSPSR